MPSVRPLRAMLAALAIACGGPVAHGEDDLVGDWTVRSVVAEDGKITLPHDMRMSFDKDGTVRTTVGNLGTTTARWSVRHRRPQSLTLEVVEDGRTSPATAEFLGGGVNLIINGSTLMLVHPPAAPAPAPALDEAKAKGAAPAPATLVAGAMGGAAWTMVGLMPNLLQDADGWHLVLLAEPRPEPGHETRPQVLVTVPRQLGKRVLDQGFNITFYFPPTLNLVCANGSLTVTALSERSVTVALTAWMDAGRQVSGTFTFDPRTIPAP